MEKKAYIVGNWKMNLHGEASEELFKNLLKKGQKKEHTVVVIAPPFVHLAKGKEHLEGSFYHLGAQDLSKFENGAHTGEISGSMLKDFKVEYVLIGHSERRSSGERNEDVAQKVAAALKAGLRPIVCFGETEEDRIQGRSLNTVAEQLEGSVLGLPKKDQEQVLLAYEPVWAIGTGKNCPPEVAEEMASFMKEKLSSPILYGGSVNEENAKSYLEKDNIDGLLVGGASLQADQFIGIMEAIA